ncbi:Probable succinyl-CoA:3-ketoacid coenzyme A transferase, mitochondrial [Geodia barretti]|uniref:Probable succinyl-CoA:3-ketoacid coenzyme A transferase, mitochondrial n=1 Tax=Geodia barretti TaxID=519541 RepID=A0AA35QTV8_GEOBA|nr:Probable succinyl-CoA:3-ketoacid coenzyme A transferase, mitochondrial [Geodia barretti]
MHADYALVRAWKADKFGNLQFRLSQRNFNPIMAMAAKMTIVEVENDVVEIGEIDPDHVHVSGIYVDRIVKIGSPMTASLFLGLIINHSENGVVGFGPLAAEGEEDRHLVNAGGQHVTPQPGMGIVHHADSFMMIRGGMIDVTVMGAYEVAENGDFANWRIPNRKGGGIGGAMDLAACAQRVFIAMEHNTREGEPRLLKRCKLPITAPGVVKMLVTDLGLFGISTDGFECWRMPPAGIPRKSRS